MSKPKRTRLQLIEWKTLTVSAATIALSKYKQVQEYLRTSIAGAQAFTLPASTGKGGLYRIFIGVTATGDKTIKAAGTDVMAGVATVSGTTSGVFGTASNSNTITLNGSTTGGVIGTLVELRDVAKGVWHANVIAAGSGTAATPFSNT